MMTPMFGLSLWLNENSILPVMLQDATGGELTGYVASSITLQKSLNGVALSTLTASGWLELGHGLYEALVEASELATEGTLVYRAATNPQGTNPAFNGVAQIVHRLDQYECHISPQYDEVTQAFTAMVWLTKNGQTVTNPVSCQIWLKDTAANVPVNLTSVSANADGVFVIQQSEIALTLDMNYECLVSVVDANGDTWSSVDGAITFN